MLLWNLTHVCLLPSSSLSSVEPPQVWFDLRLPQQTIDETKLSSLQLESIVYACQQHMNILTDGSRAGFLVGTCTTLSSSNLSDINNDVLCL